jgi:hypothetical protein
VPKATAHSNQLIGGILELVPVGSASTLRLRLLDESTERYFCLNHFLGDRSLFGVDMADGRPRTCVVLSMQ